MQKIMCTLTILCLAGSLLAQELYVSTEPASNMAAGSIGLRMNAKLFHMQYDNSYAYRLDPEVMLGISRKLMLHVNAYGSDMYGSRFHVEGAGLYGKYRFLSTDDVHSHFRMALFSKISLIDNPEQIRLGNKSYGSDEIDPDGNSSGVLAGLVATQLIHKLALSSSVYLVRRLDNLTQSIPPSTSREALNFTLSSGALLLPRVYSNFRQTNVNLYVELLGSAALDKPVYFVDAAPAIQFIFKSISRLDLSYRWQLTGNMLRLSENYFLLRFEYNLLNIFKNR
jgi:hypothetical protein